MIDLDSLYNEKVIAYEAKISNLAESMLKTAEEALKNDINTKFSYHGKTYSTKVTIDNTLKHDVYTKLKTLQTQLEIECGGYSEAFIEFKYIPPKHRNKTETKIFR